MMFQPTLVAEQRRRPRVTLNLPVRLRWFTPLGQFTETTETLDVSRGGLRIARTEPCQLGAVLWVTFPFDPAASVPQPETPAHVVRVERTPSESLHIALELVNAAGQPRQDRALDFERRGHERVPLALPLRVRQADSPWPEETMTIDVTSDGLLISTARLYDVGETVYVSLPAGGMPGRWNGGKEVPARIVRVVPSPQSIEQRVGLSLQTLEKN